MNKEINYLTEKLKKLAVDPKDSLDIEDELRPYPGLRPFEYRENFLFFGREGKAEEIAKRLQKNQFVAVVGTSGSGKSSVVRAGLLPLLYGGMLYESGSNWRIAMMRPGEMPIRNLAEALIYPVDFEIEENGETPKDETKIGMTEAVLRRSGVGIIDFVNNPVSNFSEDENLLIVVDQFEELFRFKEKSSVDYSEEAVGFVKLLLEGVKDEKGRIFIIITMRSDFLGDCAQFQGLPEAINDGQYLIPQMTREQLRQSIESPALVGGAEVSQALINRILNDLEVDRNQSTDLRERLTRDQLPVMQHALMRTWDFWKQSGDSDRLIDVKHYEVIGGIEKALSEHADKAYNKLSEEQKTIAERLFKCLTEIDSENREIRHPAKIEDISVISGVSENEIYEVIEVFRREGRNFLMPPWNVSLTKETKIDISHESLIRNWVLLKKWVKDEAGNAWLYRRISEGASLYFDDYEQDEGSLWSGRALELALEWRKKFSPRPAWAARYQYLTEEEKSELYKLRQTASLKEEIAKKQEILNHRFKQALEFLDVSAKEAANEQAAREKLLKLKAKERFNKILRWAAAGLVLLTVITTLAAIKAYQNSNAAIAAQNAAIAAQQEVERQNLELTETQKKLTAQYDELQEIREELEGKNKELEDAQKELEENNKKLGKSVEKTVVN